MGRGDLNSKKSWHPNTMKNQERVWKAEQAAAEEKKRMIELQRERAEERDRAELNDIMSKHNNASANDSRLAWMYDKPDKKVEQEAYLLGKAINKNAEQSEHVEQDPIPAVSRRVVGSSMLTSAGDTQVDMSRKIREDPLLLIKERERAARAALLNNPLQRRRLAELLRKEQEQRKETKVSKKSKKKDKDLDDLLATKLNALGGKKGIDIATLLDSDDSSSDSEDEKVKKKKKKHKKDKSKQKKKRTQSSDESDSPRESRHETQKKDKKSTESKSDKYIDSRKRTNSKDRKLPESPVRTKHHKKETRDSRRNESSDESDNPRESQHETQKSDKKCTESKSDKYLNIDSRKRTNSKDRKRSESPVRTKYHKKETRDSRRNESSDESDNPRESRHETQKRDKKSTESKSDKYLNIDSRKCTNFKDRKRPDSPARTKYYKKETRDSRRKESSDESDNPRESRHETQKRDKISIESKKDKDLNIDSRKRTNSEDRKHSESPVRTKYHEKETGDSRRNDYQSAYVGKRYYDTKDGAHKSSYYRKSPAQESEQRKWDFDEKRGKRRGGLSEEEKAARLAEMASAGAEREVQRGQRVAAQRAEAAAAERRAPALALAGHTSTARALPASLESRIHSNRHYIQRDKRHMNENFARR